MEQLVYLLLGSNLGNRQNNIAAAKIAIDNTIGTVMAQSNLYETAAWGPVPQGNYLNQAISIATGFEPLELLQKLKLIEKQLGRTETVRWGPRVIDIDIMLMGDVVMETVILTIPQRELENRRFALLPLTEIAPKTLHPLLNKNIDQLLIDCNDNGIVKPWIAE